MIASVKVSRGEFVLAIVEMARSQKAPRRIIYVAHRTIINKYLVRIRLMSATCMAATTTIFVCVQGMRE